MKSMIRTIAIVFCLVSPVMLFAQENSGLKLVWSVSADGDLFSDDGNSTKMVWSSAALAQEALSLPDSIQQIKSVKVDTDVDADGKKEFIVQAMHKVDGVNRRSVFVFENTGNDSYAPVWSFTYDGEASQFVTTDVSDLDGDGNLEILAVHIPAGSDNAAVLFVFEHTGADNDYGTAPAVSWDLDTPDDLEQVRVARAADFDNDGQQEVAMCFFTIPEDEGESAVTPSILIASVSDFNLPVWTKEFDESITIRPDLAAIALSDMDGDGFIEVVTSDGRTDSLFVIEATGPDTYVFGRVPLPAGKSVSVHGMAATDANGDGRDEVYFANLQGNVYVVSTDGNATDLDSADVHLLDATESQWLEADVRTNGSTDFVIAASNASQAVRYRYVGGTGGDVTDLSQIIPEIEKDKLQQCKNPQNECQKRIHPVQFIISICY